MAYIVVINSTILPKSGIPFEDMFFATVVASAVSLLFGVYFLFRPGG